MVGALFFQRDNARGAIHVSLHEMTAEAPIGRQGSLKIDAAFLTQFLQVCPVEGFLEQIEAKLPAATGHYREAATIDGNAVAYLDFLCYSWRDDLELRGAPISPVDPDDTADFFNQTGKHNLCRRLFCSN